MGEFEEWLEELEIQTLTNDLKRDILYQIECLIQEETGKLM